MQKFFLPFGTNFVTNLTGTAILCLFLNRRLQRINAFNYCKRDKGTEFKTFLVSIVTSAGKRTTTKTRGWRKGAQRFSTSTRYSSALHWASRRFDNAKSFLYIKLFSFPMPFHRSVSVYPFISRSQYSLLNPSARRLWMDRKCWSKRNTWLLGPFTGIIVPSPSI